MQDGKTEGMQDIAEVAHKQDATDTAAQTVVRCVRCHRRLTLPESIERGMGRVCWSKIGARVAITAAAAERGDSSPINLPDLNQALTSIREALPHSSVVHGQISHILAHAARRRYRETVMGLYHLHAIIYLQVEVPTVREGGSRLDDDLYTSALGGAFAAVGLPEERQWLQDWRTRLTDRHIKKGVWLLGSTGGRRSFKGHITAVLDMVRRDAYETNPRLKDGWHTACAIRKLDEGAIERAKREAYERFLRYWPESQGEPPSFEDVAQHVDFAKTWRVVALS